MSHISGKIDEFDESTVTPIPLPVESDPRFKWGKPAYSGTVTPCFSDGQLFRINETGNGDRWSYYNDTLSNQMQVTVEFGDGSVITALDNTTLVNNDNGTFTATVTIYPLETELFISGTVTSFKSKMVSAELSDQYLRDMALQDNELLREEVTKVVDLVGIEATTEETLKLCAENNVKFVDFNFPPEQKTIQCGSAVKMKILPWERPCMYVNDASVSQIRLFRNGVHPLNVDEGELGNTWFTGAMTAFAEFPGKIRDIFRHPISIEEGKKERAVHGYRVTLNKNGWWVNVIVDDYLPVAGGRPKFARIKGDPLELWPCILEKAYAKTFGGYGFIIAGDPLHALADISGMPCSSFDNAFMQSREETSFDFFEMLERYVNKGTLVLMSTPTTDNVSFAPIAGTMGVEEAKLLYSKVNLALGHTYAIVKVYKDVEEGLQLVQLRNCWSKNIEDQWSGMWCRKDKKWQTHLAAARYFDIFKEENSTFVMSWSDMQQFFVGCGMCFIQHPVYDYRIRGTFFQNIPTTCLEISVTVPIVMTIILSQEDTRATTKQELAPLMISVAHGGGSITPMWIDSNSGFDCDHPTSDYTFMQAREVSMYYDFHPEMSPYMIIPRTLSEYAKMPYTIGVLSPLEIGSSNSSVRIAFRSFAPHNRVFGNFTNFPCETIATEVEFQAKSVNQCFPDTFRGTVLRTSNE